ncbi:ABC transporter ATP-binding protein [Lysobacter sp. 1R34A]|uniref:ABC transporter ATP-binding protein n=1 Tax=Lysobacter sp. 1R34A TaxID=3445786 RepID=UPI003EEB65BA
MYEAPIHRLWQSLFRGHKRFYREFWALHDVSFEVGRGETFGVIGKNGSGKSTLLQILCGTLNSSSGRVECVGRVAALLELGAGFNPEFTGRQNAILSGGIYGLSGTEIEQRLPRIIEFAEIGDFIDRPVKTYSSGMFVRLAFAVIAHVDADILVIDEALAVGDAQFTQKCMRFLRDFKERGTLIFVSHDTSAVRSLCDRALWLEGGVVRAVGDAKSVSEKYLASLFNSTRKEASGASSSRKTTEVREWRDQRRELLTQEPLRNDLQVFSFATKNAVSASFGEGGVELTDVHLEDEEGHPLSWVVGGEMVRLVVNAYAQSRIESPIVGFFLKDSLGQTLFGDNTYLSYAETPVSVAGGSGMRASFLFPMPILPKGDYSFDVAIADGNGVDHRQLHWGHDVVLVRSVATSTSTGLIGIPMLDVLLEEKS